MPTHEKGRDRDKYYQLAKDQGYRSRAAFKLIQINKRYDFLRNAKVCIDLCAAPGGWCQVAAKTMPVGSLVIGVDLLPIKSIRGVQTIVGDITTAACRKDIVTALKGWKADVVLCDGAPNIGAAYAKDAFVQNELVLSALKTATEHLVKGGTFCTKVYRSVDSHALTWAIQQLFEDVQSMKPNSSRSQSSEIFLIATGYTAPAHIDARLFDINHVFKEVQGGADGSTSAAKGPDVLHKKHDVQKRHRSGYDEKLGMTLSATVPVSEFILSSDPVRLLTDVHTLSFDSPDCEKYKLHPKTSPETIIACSDLQVLGKIDFKKLLKWRDAMKDAFHVDHAAEAEKKAKLEEAKKAKADAKLAGKASIENLDEELLELREAMIAKKRKEEKKARLLASKERARQAVTNPGGAAANVFEESVDTELFSLSTVKALKGDKKKKKSDDNEESEDEEALANALIAKEEEEKQRVIDEQLARREAVFHRYGIHANPEDDGDYVDEDDEDEERRRTAEEEAELEEDYVHFLALRGAKKKARGVSSHVIDNERTLSSKRERARESALGNGDEEDVLHDEDSEADSEAEEDAKKKQRSSKRQNAATEEVRNELEQYVQLLQNKREKKATNGAPESESDSDSDDYEEVGEDMDSEDDAPVATSKRVKGNTAKSQASKWFDNALFSSLTTPAHNPVPVRNTDGSDAHACKKQKTSSKSNRATSTGTSSEEKEEALLQSLSMPRTDKEKRAEKRKRNTERSERKNEERAAMLHDPEDEEEGAVKISGSKRALGQDFEIVPQSQSKEDSLMQRHDSRTYDSDEEVYDNTDRAHTLALGTYLLRKERRKALIDASYNRFAWNDPNGLPSWFMDDELRHNKPQLPVPQALVEQIKNKYSLTGQRVIKKVAEARARKRKRATDKLKSAKKQAAVFAENSELSERQKVKAISKALRNTKASEKSSKVYVATRKTQAGSVGTAGKNKGGKGSQLKFVDSRMKKDRRAAKVLEKKQKKGGKGKRRK